MSNRVGGGKSTKIGRCHLVEKNCGSPYVYTNSPAGALLPFCFACWGMRLSRTRWDDTAARPSREMPLIVIATALCALTHRPYENETRIAGVVGTEAIRRDDMVSPPLPREPIKYSTLGGRSRRQVRSGSQSNRDSSTRKFTVCSECLFLCRVRRRKPRMKSGMGGEL